MRGYGNGPSSGAPACRITAAKWPSPAVFAELIEPQSETLNIKLTTQWSGAHERLKHKESEKRSLIEKIEDEKRRAGCTQKAALEKLVPGQQRNTERILKEGRQRREQIELFLKPLLKSFADMYEKAGLFWHTDKK